jgi:acyl-CoA thioesterase I
MRITRALATVAAVTALAVGCVACAGGGTVGERALPSVSPSGPRLVYVAIGASESVGIGADDPIRQAWTAVFYRLALPRAAVFVNLGIPGATVADALRRQVPEAVSLHPDVVTVFLNANDLIGGVPVSTYRSELTSLLRRVRDGGRAVVLVANLPSLRSLPRFAGCPAASPCEGSPRSGPALDATVRAYDAAVAAAAARAGAIVVDLHAVGAAIDRSGDAGDFVAADGFHPNAAGHRLIADAFVRAYRRIAA